MSTFGGFSEEDLKKIKSIESATNNEPIQDHFDLTSAKKIEKIGSRSKHAKPPNRLALLTQLSDEITDLNFEKCRLSLKSPESDSSNNNNNNESIDINGSLPDKDNSEMEATFTNIDLNDNAEVKSIDSDVKEEVSDCTSSIAESAPDIVRGVANYTEDDLAAHKAKLQDLQLKQKLMEEQNKKRKEMLAKALADRAKRTEEEVQKLEKIKKELHVLDGQFSHDVAVLRKKIDQACLTYADAEKHYLKVEKEFLQAKIHLQKEKEKKELLTEHLCTLITHNETRKAQKLETLMLQLVEQKCGFEQKGENEQTLEPFENAENLTPDEEGRIIVDGIDIKTGKMIEIPITR